MGCQGECGGGGGGGGGGGLEQEFVRKVWVT